MAAADGVILLLVQDLAASTARHSHDERLISPQPSRYAATAGDGGIPACGSPPPASGPRRRHAAAAVLSLSATTSCAATAPLTVMQSVGIKL